MSRFLELKGFLSFLILHELGKKSRCGDDLAKRIGRRKGTTLTPGTIYPALKELRAHQLIEYTQFGRKKMYVLTPAGEKELKALYKEFSRYFYGLKALIHRETKKKARISKQKAEIIEKKED
jgi:DNA-binding PadR family transcriptional regulator